MKGDNVRLVAVLKAQGAVSMEQLQRAMAIQKNSGDIAIEDVLLQEKMVTPAQIESALRFMDKPSGKATVRREEITTMMQVLQQETKRQVTDLQELANELNKELGG